MGVNTRREIDVMAVHVTLERKVHMRNAGQPQNIQITIGRISDHVVELITINGQTIQVPMNPTAALQVATQMMVQAAECFAETARDEVIAKACPDCQVKLARHVQERAEAADKARREQNGVVEKPRILKPV